MSIWRGSRHGSNTHSDEASVVTAAERLLAGGAIGLFRDAGYPSAPTWAYLNRLAHSTVEELAALAEATGRARPGGWGATLGYIAAELLTFEKCAAQVDRTQREVLIRLELDMLDGEVYEPDTPAEFLSLVMGALEQHRTWRTW